MKENFDFNDVNLIPKKGIVGSRSECDTSVQFGKFKFKIPVVPANMESIINEDLAITLAQNGYFYILHRFNIDSLAFIERCKEAGQISSISIGVNDADYELLNNLSLHKVIPDYITIDIAHGHCIKMENMLKEIRCNSDFDDTFIIAGNVSTPEAFADLSDWGANAVKAGIGGGLACSTYMETKFGNRGMQASMIKELNQYRELMNINAYLISDGAIRERGDINVALVMGADMIMVGGLFSGHLDSPGEIIEIDGKEYKGYWGSASVHQSGKTNRIEGVKHQVPLKNKSILDEMTSIQEALQSGISYAGGRDLNIFKETQYKVK